MLKWSIIIVILELFLFLFPALAWKAFLALGVAFLVGLLLRLLGIYPGKYEPLVLDLFSGALAIMCGIVCFAARNSPIAVRLFILMAPPFALIPHFVYIINTMRGTAQESPARNDETF